MYSKRTKLQPQLCQRMHFLTQELGLSVMNLSAQKTKVLHMLLQDFQSIKKVYQNVICQEKTIFYGFAKVLEIWSFKKVELILFHTQRTDFSSRTFLKVLKFEEEEDSTMWYP